MHPGTRLHDVRHAVATELGRRGVHAVIVSAALGHANPAFTVAVYQHAWQDGPREAALALEAALGPRSSGVGNPLANSVVQPTGNGSDWAKSQVGAVGRAGLEPATDGL